MLLIKNKINIYLYFFFLLFILVFIKFSTTIAFADNYTVKNIRIKEQYDINFNKDEVINKGLDFARKNRLVTFGVIPRSPHTGYGYIKAENPFNTKNISGENIISRSLYLFIRRSVNPTGTVDLITIGFLGSFFEILSITFSNWWVLKWFFFGS